MKYKKIACNYGSMTVAEKAASKGVEAMSNKELLQAMVGGVKYANQIAKDLNALISKQGINNLTIEDVKTIKGIGDAKAALIFSALEFWHRQFKPKDIPLIDSPEEAARQLDYIRDKKQEYVVLLTLDGARRLINKHTVSIGTLMSALIHPREVFALAIEDRAASIILGHNHPSGTLCVSEHDRNATKRIREAGQIIGIELDDHIVVSKNGFVSAR